MACGCGGKNQSSAPLGRRTKVSYCVTTPSGDECFAVMSEAKRFARKFAYPMPRTVAMA